MASFCEILRHPDDLYPLLKLKMAMRHSKNQIPQDEPHWGFCYSMLHKVSRSFALVILQLDTELRNAVCIFYLVLRALDTVEDDTSIAKDVKVPILLAFHNHISDHGWHFSCGTNNHKVLMDEFHHVTTAFLELDKSYQEAIKDITLRMGAGMAKFICKEVETIEDYDEYCHYVAGLVGLGLSRIFHAYGTEDLASDSLSNSMGLFLQKVNIIQDYAEDIKDIPNHHMCWPREIWSKYVDKLEDLKEKENSFKAVQCLNDMVTNTLTHVEDCLKYMKDIRSPTIFRFCAIPQVYFAFSYLIKEMAQKEFHDSLDRDREYKKKPSLVKQMFTFLGIFALCYNNVEVFRGVVKMRRGLVAKVIDRTNTMEDVYGAFFDFSQMLKTKVDNNDPNATKTLKSIETIQKVCLESGTMNKRKSYIISNGPMHNSALILIMFAVIAILLTYLSAN